MDNKFEESLGRVVHLQSELIEKEDLVKLISDPSVVGEVMQVGWESDEESDDEELEENEIRVDWLGVEESEIVSVDEIFVSDKTFIRENLVAFKGSHKQSGTVSKIDIAVDLQFLDGKVYKDVPIGLLQPLFDCEADYVVKGESMGVISGQNEFLRIRFGDNPRDFWISAEEVERHEDQHFPTGPCLFFPGQKIHLDDYDELYNNYSKDAQERKHTKKRVSSKLGTVAVVQEIVVDSLDINWFLIQGNGISELSEQMHPDEVTIVQNPSRHRKVGIGFRLRFKEEAVAYKRDYLDPERTVIPRAGKSKSARKQHKYFRFLDTVPQCGLVIDLHTTYSVTWQDGSVSENVTSTELVGYDPAGVNEFWPRSIVCRSADELDKQKIDESTWGVVISTNIDEQMVNVKWVTNKGQWLHEPLEESLSLFSLVTHPDYNMVLPEKLVVRYSDGEIPFLKAIGEVIDIIDGIATVYWLDNSRSDVPLNLLNFLDDEIGEDYDDEDCESHESEECEDCDEPEDESSINEEEEQALVEIAEKEARKVSKEEQSASIKDTPSYPFLEKFSRFNSLAEPPLTHQYLNISSTLGPRPTRAIFKEWALLQNNLPEGIFVRSFDSNLDLLQVLIIGPKNTPYHDSVFVFDVKFADDHPRSVPSFYFHSVIGEKINPNLYTDGNICLSLLGTWNGEGVEVWNPSTSTMLQVILSIQGLILGTEEPYFLEAGFEKRKGSSLGFTHSMKYNPTAILGTLRHSLKSYQLAKENLCYTAELNDIIICQLENSAQNTITRIQNYLEFVEQHASPNNEELRQFFHVPIEHSAAFAKELSKYLIRFQNTFLP